ncbi:MAG: hypothetical protein AAB897_03105 [Patescibacteria group bacterium]
MRKEILARIKSDKTETKKESNTMTTENTAVPARVQLADTLIYFGEEAKKALEPKILSEVSEQGRRGEKGYRARRKASVFTKRHNFTPMEALKITAMKELKAEVLTTIVIPEGEPYAGRTAILIPTAADYDRLVTNIKEYWAKKKAEKEQREAERIANSPENLARQATDTLTRVRHSLSFYSEISDPEGGRRRPGPRLDLSAFETELGDLNGELVKAQFAKDTATLKSVAERAVDAHKRMDTTYLAWQLSSLDSRLAAHSDELDRAVTHEATSQMRVIMEAYGKDGDAQKARRALVDVDKVISGQVKQVRGGTYQRPERNDDRSGRPSTNYGSGGTHGNRVRERAARPGPGEKPLVGGTSQRDKR